MRALVAAVGVAAATGVLHGGVHATVPVPLAEWQAAYVAVVLFLAPVAGAALAVRGRVRTGATLIAASAVLALGFEAVAHFVIRNPDHVAAVADGNTEFAVTAALSVAGDAIALAIAVRVLRTRSPETATAVQTTP